MPALGSLYVYELCSLLHSYALAGRFYPDIITKVCQLLKIKSDITKLTWEQINNVLWALAKLNYKPDDKFIVDLIAIFLRQASEHRFDPSGQARPRLSLVDSTMIPRSLWAMAALQELTYETLSGAGMLLYLEKARDTSMANQVGP